MFLPSFPPSLKRYLQLVRHEALGTYLAPFTPHQTLGRSPDPAPREPTVSGEESQEHMLGFCPLLHGLWQIITPWSGKRDST